MIENSESPDTTTEGIYVLKLTEEESRTVRWVGGRYCWSDALLGYLGCAESEEGAQLSLEDVNYLRDQFEEDTEGGHDFFPCLRPGSSLYLKLSDLYRSGEDLE